MERSPSPLVLKPVDRDERYVLEPNHEAGGFAASERKKAEAALADDDGQTHPLHPRLLDILYETQRHFRAPWLYVISGYRDGRSTSRHTHGRAVDIVVPGVSDRRLASYLTKQGFVGVGLYRVSGFVHLDVRRRSYFWVDTSRPGAPSRDRPVFRERAARTDARARARGETPVTPLAGATEGSEQ
jgi:hypothetical protein